MALIHIDGFDHYGSDTAKLTEGIYDQADSDFSLSSANPRTGPKNLRRNSNQSDARLIKNFATALETVGSGFALYMSKLPNTDSSYALFSLMSQSGEEEMTFVIDSDGSIRALLGDVNGAEIASSGPSAVTPGQHNHIEIATKADTSTEISTTFVSTWDINTLTNDGNSLNTGLSATSSYFVSYDGKHIISSERASFPFDGRFHGWTLSVPFDLTTAVKKSGTPTNDNQTPSGVYVSPDGLRAYVNDRTDSVFRQYSMSTAYDVSSLTLVATTSTISGALFHGCFLTEDGRNLYFCDNLNNVSGITHYKLTIPWSITTAVHQGYFDINSEIPTQTGDATSITGRPDGSHLYVFGTTQQKMYDILLTDPDDISTATIVDTRDASSGPNVEYVAASDGSYLFSDGPIINRWVFEVTNVAEVSDGIVEARVNGVTEFSISNAKNTPSGDTKFYGIDYRFGSSRNHGVISDIDDLFIWDDIGAWNNSFIGDRRCFLLKPNQDTNIADFEPSSGSFGYKMIDDDSPDDDSTYIIAEAYLQSGSPLTGTSEFEIEDLPDGTSLISGINVVTRASKTDSTSAEFFTSINSGANSLSQSAHTLTTTYGYFSDIYEYDPATIASLTRDGFDDLSFSITADDLQEEITVISPDIVSPSVIPGSPTDSDPSIPSDYIARYIFDGDFTDETGTYNGTNNGATFLGAGNGPNGTDFGINAGAGKFVSLPVSLAAALGSGSGTLSCAIKTGAATNFAIALCGSDTATANNFLILAIGDGTALRPRVVHDSGNSYRGDSSGSINTWHHMIIRSDGSSTTFRLNGVNLGTVVVAGSDTGAWFGDVASIDNMLIGRLDRSSADNNGQSFDIAFLTLFDREISDAEAQQLETEY